MYSESYCLLVLYIQVDPRSFDVEEIYQFSTYNMGKLYRRTLKRYLNHVVCAPGQNVLCFTQEHHQVNEAKAWLRRYEIHVCFIVFTIICR